MEHSQTQTLRIGSWNIRKCIGTDRRRDPVRVARVLSELEADVIALQEVDRRWGRRPAALPSHILEAHGRLRPVELDGHADSLGWHGNAVLLAEGLTVSAQHTLHLPGLEPRGAVIVDIGGRSEIRLVGVHMGLLRGSRRQQWRAILNMLERLPRMPTVMAGDFNEWSPKTGIEMLHDFDVHAPGHSFHARRPVAPLDRFALGDGVALHNASVVETPATRLASDHLPICCDVRLG